MTGYGQSELSRDGLTIKIEIQSLNSRYFDLSLRVARQLQPSEAWLRSRAQDALVRGKVTLSASYTDDAQSNSTAEIDGEKIEYYRDMFAAIRTAAGLAEEATLGHYLAQNDILMTTEADSETDATALLEEVFDAALAELVEMRGKEGDNMRADLEARLALIETEVTEIGTLAIGSRQEEFERYKAKVRELTEGISLDEDRLVQELAILAEKRDIAEECTRMMSHSSLFKEYLGSGEATGKKMGFLLQEMGREINTIGSKSSSLGISHKVVAMKDELERMREQVQNIL